jgi:hypothetical protein
MMEYDEIMMGIGVEHKCLQLDIASDEAEFAAIHADGLTDGLVDIMYRIARRTQMVVALDMVTNCGTMALLIALQSEISDLLGRKPTPIECESKIKRDALQYVNRLLAGKLETK